MKTRRILSLLLTFALLLSLCTVSASAVSVTYRCYRTFAEELAAPSVTNAESVLREHRSVCEGYVNLTCAML